MIVGVLGVIAAGVSSWQGEPPELSPTVWLLPLAVAFLAATFLTPAAIVVANRVGLIDRPVGQKIHKLPTPLLGGTAVYGAFLVTSLIFLPVQGPVRGLLAGGAVAIAVGILDDRYNLLPLVHLSGQTLAAVVTLVAGLPYVSHVSNPLASAASQAQGQGSWTLAAPIGIAFTLFWLVGMMNTVNFLDGLDGLSSGVGVIVALTLGIWAWEEHGQFLSRNVDQLNHAPVVLAFILAGALLGFLLFNWSPARVFIGDSGALFIGLTLGVLSIFGIAKIGTALIIVSIPILDVAWAIVRRTMHRKSFLAGDKQHVYHRMIELGMSTQSVVVLLYAICASLAVIDLNIAHKPKLIAFGVIVVLVGAGFMALEMAGNRRRASAPTRERPREAEALRG